MKLFKTLHMTKDDQKKKESYDHTWQHYQDELQRLDVKIACLMYRDPLEAEQGQTDPMHSFKGMIITREQTEHLLTKSSSRSAQDQQLAKLEHQVTQYDSGILMRKQNSIEQGIFLPLAYVTKMFQLDAFEEHCLFTCLALELDRKYEKLYAYLQDDIQQKYPTVDLLLKLHLYSFEDLLAGQEYFAPDSKLFSYFFKKEQSQQHQPLLSRRVQLDDRIIRFLLHSQEQDHLLTPFTEYVHPNETLPPLHFDQEIQDRICRYLTNLIEQGEGHETELVLFLKGEVGSGKKLHVRHVCQQFQQKVLIVDLEKMLVQVDDLEQTLLRIVRESTLQKAVLCFSHFEAMLDEDQRNNEKNVDQQEKLYIFSDIIKRFIGVVFLLSEKDWKPLDWLAEQTFIRIEFHTPLEKESEHFWRFLGEQVAHDELNWGNMASKFRFTPGQIVKTMQTAQSLADWEDDLQGQVSERTIVKAAYSQVQHKLEKKATRLTPRSKWDDIVLPEDQKDLMRMACNQIKFRHVVFDEWGFHRRLSYGKGVSMLFSGPPGTGKTMSAEVIATELLLEIYKIDLSQVISKYIGETEKNLNIIFTEAQASNAILFFDETDALFGKRSEVKDSKDKYANIEVAYLLQKMEEYQGITVLATNLLQNIDEAFLRRINFVIKFPFPDAIYRERIWKAMFPEETPLDEDIDFQYVAEKLHIAGGNIKNIALSAAFQAAEAGQSVNMRHIIKAAKHEMQKMGKILIREDFEDFWE